MKNIKNNSGYTVMISLLIIGFLLVLTTGIFNLILNELKDNKSLGDYMKSYAGAEAGSELALLKIKKYGYEYYDKIDHNINSKSILLAENNLNIADFKKQKDLLLSYDMQTKTNDYFGELEILGYDIIPLFYIDKNGDEQKIDNYSITILEGSVSDLSWNIIGKDKGLSGVGNDLSGILKTIDVNGNFLLSTKTIINFLDESNSNYLVLFNSSNTNNIKYNIKNNNNQYFIKPKTSIISSASIGNYRQNISTKLDNTKFLNMLKYSIYSN